MRRFTFAAGLAMAVLSSAANGADLWPEQPEIVSSSATDWSGFYFGLNGGYGPGTATGTIGLDYSVSYSGLFGGGQVGHNFQLENGLVFGVEADLNRTNESGTTEFSYSFVDTLNWSGAVTGRVGYAWDIFMPYVLGGVAFANNTYGMDDNGTSYSGSATHLGYTVGLGAAAMLTDNISAFTEVRYADYGSARYSWEGLGYTFPVTLVDTTVRGGLNIHF